MATDPATCVPTDQHGGNHLDAIIAYVVCAVILMLLTAFAIVFDPAAPSPTLITLLWGVAGSALGWATGIFSSPYDGREEAKFRGFAKAIYAFVTGYALAKLDPVLTYYVDAAKTSGLSVQGVSNLAIGLVSFVSVATATYASRKYWL